MVDFHEEKKYFDEMVDFIVEEMEDIYEMEYFIINKTMKMIKCRVSFLKKKKLSSMVFNVRGKNPKDKMPRKALWISS